MDYYVADPHWGAWIILYFYLGGIAAGAYFTATLIDLLGGEEDREFARLGYLVAFPLICLCGLFLIIDLDRPARFWHMLFKSEVPGVAFMFKHWSPMSVGSWALTLFGLCSLLSLFGSLWPGSLLERLFRRGPFARGLQVVGCFVGFFIAAYTGSLLAATNQPVWSDSTWVAALFLTSAASTGIALILILAEWRGVPQASVKRLERADLWALGLELLVFAAFLASLGGDLLAVLGSWNGRVLVVGVLVFGLLLPLAFHLRLGLSLRARGAILAAAFALFGGFLLRYALVKTPPELLARGPAGVARFSPEDGRPRGEGTGADADNRGGPVRPESKVFDGE